MNIDDKTPVRLVEGVLDDGRMVLTRRKFGPLRSALLRLFRISPDLTIRLDPLGTRVWQLMDGRTAGEILAVLEAELPHETQLGPRLGAFLSTMVRANVAAIQMH